MAGEATSSEKRSLSAGVIAPAVPGRALELPSENRSLSAGVIANSPLSTSNTLIASEKRSLSAGVIATDSRSASHMPLLSEKRSLAAGVIAMCIGGSLLIYALSEKRSLSAGVIAAPENLPWAARGSTSVCEHPARRRTSDPLTGGLRRDRRVIPEG